MFNFSGNLHTVLHSVYTNLHSHQHCSKVPFFPTSSPFLLFLVSFFFFFFHNNYPARYEMMSHYGFDLLPLMIHEVEHLFMWLHMHDPLHAFSGKILFRSSAHFLNWIQSCNSTLRCQRKH